MYNKRKIDKEVIQFYYQKGMIYECSYDHSVVFVGYDEKWVLEKGDFRIQVGDQVINVRATETKKWDSPNRD